MTGQEQRQAAYRGCVVLFSVLGSAFLWLCLFTFDPVDWPSVTVWPHPEPALNACGRAGAWVAYHLFYYFGDGAYPLALGVTLAVVMLIWRGRVPHLWQRVFGVSLIVAVTSVSVNLIGPEPVGLIPVQQGGVLGIGAGYWLSQNFSTTGTILVLAYCFFVGIAFTAEGLVARAPTALRQVGRASGQAVAAAYGRLPMRPIPLGAGGTSPGTIASRSGGAGGVTGVVDEADEEETESDEAAVVVETNGKVVDDDGDGPYDDEDDEDDDDDDDFEEDYDSDDDDEDEDEEDEDDDDRDLFDQQEAAPSKPPVKVVNLRPHMMASGGGSAPTAAPAPAYPKELGEWKLPELSLLVDPEYLFSEQQETIVREKAVVLEKTLSEFRIEAHVVEIDTGPVITMYELQLAPGIKVSQIQALANDIARALKALAVRVVAPIPGKNTVGIEVPNADKETVRIKELITLAGDRLGKMALPLFLGKDASGNPLIADLAVMPHMLIAGTTGSGKSVCINSIVMSFLMTQRPDMLKLILVDPKMVEMSQFKSIPHLMCPIVNDMARAEKILDWAATKMDERYELLAEAGVRNIAAFNRMSKEEIYERFQPTSDEERATIPTHMPRIVIIIDELADLMMTAAKEVEHHLSRLAQKSRAVGIHIIVATQRPEAKIVTGLIKSNLPCRMAFRVSSRMDSRIVLDQNGAEVLLGQGDALFLPPGSAKLIRAQGTYIEDGELKAVIKELTDRGEPEFHPELTRLKTDDALVTGERDPLFDDAVHVVLESRRGSVSLLQRKLTIGYSRASRLIEQMAEAGVVGDYKGSQAREVAMTLEEWEAYRAQVADEVQNGNYAADQDEVPFEGDDGDNDQT